MADSTNELLLWGDDFEALLDVLKDTEVEEQCAGPHSSVGGALQH